MTPPMLSRKQQTEPGFAFKPFGLLVSHRSTYPASQAPQVCPVLYVPSTSVTSNTFFHLFTTWLMCSLP